MLPIGGLPPSLQEEGHLGDFLNFVEVRKDSLCASSDPGSYSRNAGKSSAAAGVEVYSLF